MATAYFGNGDNDTINVNLNNELGGKTLNPRALDTTKTNFMLPLASYPIGPNKDKGKFGGKGQKNKVTVQFASLSDEAQYTIEVDSTVTGQDLYFYVFENTLVGQDQAGRSSGITITEVPVKASATKSKS